MRRLFLLLRFYGILKLIYMKNLVLGRGLVGSELITFLKGKGEEVAILSRSGGHDLRNAEKYIGQFKWADRVWFVAWDIGVWKGGTTASYEAEILDSNLRLCQSIFRCLEKTGKPFLFTSSQAAPSSQMLTLGVTKRVGEMWSKLLGGHIARFWNVYGWEPVGERSHLIPDLIWKAMGEKKMTLMTNGEETRQFLYVRDCVEAIVHQFDIGQKLADVTSWEWVPVKAVAERIGAKLGAEIVLGKNPGKPSLHIPETHLASWSPRFSLDQGLNETIAQAQKAWNQRSSH